MDWRPTAEPGSLRIDTVEGARASARGAVHSRLPGVAFNHESEPACDEFDAWAAKDFAELRCGPPRFAFDLPASAHPLNCGRGRWEDAGLGTLGESTPSAGKSRRRLRPLQQASWVLSSCCSTTSTRRRSAMARWPSLDWVLVTMNLVGEFSGVFESGGEGDDDNDAYAAIVDEMEDQATARQVCGEQPRAVLVCSFRHLGLSRACVGKWSVFMK